MGVKDYDLNPDNNTQINGINIAEGCPPSGINNAIRQLMADVRADSDAQNQALKTFSETPASAEDLGPVKVGSGLSADEDGLLTVAVDGKTTKIVDGKVVTMDVAISGDASDLASGRGQIGDTPLIRQAVIDFNTYTRSGAWWVTWDDEALNAPEIDAGVNGLLVVYAVEGQQGKIVRQFFYRWGTAGTTDENMWTRSLTSNVTEWGPWYRINNSSRTIIDVDSQSDNTSVVGMSFGIYGKGVDGVKRILFPFRFVPGNSSGNGLVIDTGGLVVIGGGESGRNVAAGLVSEGLSGEKETLYLTSDNSIELLFGQNAGYDPLKYFRIDANGRMYLSADDPDIVLRCLGLEKGQIPESEIFNTLAFSDKIGNGNASHFSIVESAVRKNGDVDIKLAVFPNEAGNSVFSSMGIKMLKDKTSYSWCPTPVRDSNTNHIATTEWVRALIKEEVEKQRNLWVFKTSGFSVTNEIGVRSLDFSNYLPNDNYQYEVLLKVFISRSDSSSTNTNVYVKTPNDSSYIQTVADGSNFQQAVQSAIAIVDSSRTLKYEVEGYAPSVLKITAYGYKKV